MGALPRTEGVIDFIQVRHEELAGLMAVGHAKFTGEVGVCLATQGPGALHLLNGLYDAKLDHQPVLAIVGQQARSAIGSHYSRTSICRACSRTWRSTSRRPSSRHRCLILLIVPIESPKPTGVWRS